MWLQVRPKEPLREKQPVTTRLRERWSRTVPRSLPRRVPPRRGTRGEPPGGAVPPVRMAEEEHPQIRRPGTLSVAMQPEKRPQPMARRQAPLRRLNSGSQPPFPETLRAPWHTPLVEAYVTASKPPPDRIARPAVCGKKKRARRGFARRAAHSCRLNPARR